MSQDFGRSSNQEQQSAYNYQKVRAEFNVNSSISAKSLTGKPGKRQSKGTLQKPATHVDCDSTVDCPP